MPASKQRKKHSKTETSLLNVDDVQTDQDVYTWSSGRLSISLEEDATEAFISRPSLTVHCDFPPSVFVEVMENLIQNPNITSSHLFRADVYYDSEKDPSFAPEAWSPQVPSSSSNDGQPTFERIGQFVKHMRKELKPRRMYVKGFELRRVLVRKMVPRNPSLDKSLVQTCCFFRLRDPAVDPELSPTTSGIESSSNFKSINGETNVVVYLPHVECPEEIPWYHPKVRAVTFCYGPPNKDNKIDSGKASGLEFSCLPPQNDKFKVDGPDDAVQHGELSIFILPFEESDVSSDAFTRDSRLNRTLQNLLLTIKKHGRGIHKGYQKRSNHDQIVPRADLQDTFTRLKQKYAKTILHEYWQENTDSTKGVFEEMGIAAFLIELWRQMFRNTTGAGPNRPFESHESEPDNLTNGINHIKDSTREERPSDVANDKKCENYDSSQKPLFPGFVDIGCGNGVLTYILLSEGYRGYGFDAWGRKTWTAFPERIRQHLKRMVLLPAVLNDPVPCNAEGTLGSLGDGLLSKQGTRILSDQFPVEIHSGLFVPGTFIISNHADELTPWTPLLAYLSSCSFISIPCCSHDLTGAKFRYPASFLRLQEKKAGWTSSDEASRSKTKTKEGRPVDPAYAEKQPVPSAYSTLTAFVAHVTGMVGYEVEKEMLRIPSTRNACIVGRSRKDGFASGKDVVEKWKNVQHIIESETGRSIAQVKDLWWSSAEEVVKCKDNHGKRWH